MDVTSRLCSTCLSLVSTSERGTVLDHHPSVNSLFKSAETGCPLCALLCDYYFNFQDTEKLSPRNPERHLESISLKYKAPRHFYSGEWIFTFYVHDNATGKSPDKVEHENVLGSFTINPVIPAQDEIHPPVTKISYRTDSEESWQLAFHWIQQCIKSHPKCNQKRTDNWMPTRLLDLGLPGWPQLRLWLTNKTSHRSPYMTLSHCWGQLQIKRLEATNLQTLCEGITLSELPKTFQDAIKFTRASGVRYLWIDSLCIIQDSITDWQKESAVMGDVYKNAVCNIAATAAPDGRFGCFFERDPELVIPCRVQSKSFPKQGSDSELFELVPNAIWAHNVDNAPLNSRSWVMQERFLSSKIIHCGRNQLFWECHELIGWLTKQYTACESYPAGLPRGPVGNPHKAEYETSSLWQDTKLTTATTQKTSALKSWNSILYSYVQCSLTQDSDKLVATSAVAKEFQPLIKAEYVAGLWDYSLPLQLLWSVYMPPIAKQVPRRAKTYCAPTWSWASVVADVQPCDIDEIKTSLAKTGEEPYMIQILEYKVDHVTDDLTGQVSGGYLKVKGWLRSLREFELEDADTNICQLVLHGKSYAGPDMDTLQVYRCDELYFLPVAELRFDEKAGTHVTGLILVGTGVEGQYQRVGILKTEFGRPFRFKPPPYRQDVPNIDRATFETGGFETETDDSGSTGSSEGVELENAKLSEGSEKQLKEEKGSRVSGGGTDFVMNSEPVPRDGTESRYPQNDHFERVGGDTTDVQADEEVGADFDFDKTSDSGDEWLSDSLLEFDEEKIEDSENPEDEDSWTETIFMII